MEGEVEDFLAHYGVKGMKWGVRNKRRSERKEAKSIAKADKKWEKTVTSIRSHIKVYNQSTFELNKHIDNFNSSWEKTGKPYGNEYYAAYSKHAEKIFQKNADAMFGRTNASGTKKIVVNYDVTKHAVPVFTVQEREIRHESSTYSFVGKVDNNGKIKELVPSESISHSDVEDFLAHYGVKGMKWGVRKAERPGGASRRTNREAKKDAEEFTRAKMFYGDGAGTRRKLIKAKVNEKSKRDPTYKAAFDHHVNQTDMSKRASQARSERRRKDTSAKAKKGFRGTVNILNGNSQAASATTAFLVGGAMWAHANGVDKAVYNSVKSNAGKVKASYTNKQNQKLGEEFLRKNGF